MFPSGARRRGSLARAGSAYDSKDEIIGLVPEPRVLADREACWATRLVWGALLACLSPELTIGLVGVVASGSVAPAASLAPGRASALPAAIAARVNHAA